MPDTGWMVNNYLLNEWGIKSPHFILSKISRSQRSLYIYTAWFLIKLWSSQINKKNENNLMVIIYQ